MHKNVPIKNVWKVLNFEARSFDILNIACIPNTDLELLEKERIRHTNLKHLYHTIDVLHQLCRRGVY